MKKIASVNLELTTACPLRCPQCYCSLDKGRHMHLEVAKYWLNESSKHNVKSIALSGGETMCYPHLYEVIEEAKKYGFQVAAAFSGWAFTKDVVDKLVSSGLDQICISLNGSTEEVNCLTRDGYSYAINALGLLCRAQYNHTVINWVMHSNNVEDFDSILRLAECYNVETIDIISFKPDSKNQMNSVPSLNQMMKIAKKIKSYRGAVKIAVESCYSPLRALVGETALFGNLNLGINKGCRAGQVVASVSVDGLLSPCRHLPFYEHYDNFEDYFNKSPVLEMLHLADKDVREPCVNCKYLPNCRHCLAINQLMNGSVYIGNETCQLWMQN